MANDVQIRVGMQNTASPELQKLLGDSQKVGREMEKSFSRLKDLFMGIGAGMAVRGIFEAGKKIESLGNSLEAIAGSGEAAKKELDFLRDTADRLGLEFYSTADAYKGISAAAKGTALEGQAVREVFLAVSEASTVLGLSSDQTQGALLALSQMISKGTVQAEELRGQLGERLPGAFQLAAKAMGVSTSELDKMLKGGQILAEDLLPRLAVALREQYGSAVEKASNSAVAGFNRFKNAVEDMKISVGKSGGMEVITQSLQDMTRFLKENESSIKSFTREVFDFSKSVISGFNQLPPWAREVGLIGAVLFGKKGMVGLVGAARLIDALGQSYRGFQESLKGHLSWQEFTMMNYDELKKKLEEIDKVNLKALRDTGTMAESGLITWSGFLKIMQQYNMTLDQAVDKSVISQKSAEMLAKKYNLSLQLPETLGAFPSLPSRPPSPPGEDKAAAKIREDMRAEDVKAAERKYKLWEDGEKAWKDYNDNIFAATATQYEKDLQAADDWLQAQRNRLNDAAISYKEYQARITEAERVADDMRGIAYHEDQMRQVDDATKIWKEGEEDKETITNQTYDRMKESMADFLYSGITGELESFKDTWEALWKSLARIAANALAEDLFNYVKKELSGLSGGKGGGFNLGSIVSGITGFLGFGGAGGGGGTSYLDYAAAAGWSGLSFASGGTISEPSWLVSQRTGRPWGQIAEAGPESVAPFGKGSSGGTVINNYNYFHTQAWDAPGVDQFIKRNAGSFLSIVHQDLERPGGLRNSISRALS